MASGRTSRRGFTLVEVLVTLAILALVAGLTAPSLVRGVETARFNAAVREVAAALRGTRVAAMSRQEEALFTIDVEMHELSAAGESRHLDVPAGTEITLLTADIERQSDSSGAIRFFPDGSATGGTVALAFRTRHATVEVDWLTGHVELGP
jgi:general secretion pathway protein H